MSMNRDNFRANQPPSKVLHIRNLPPEVTEEEVVELCRPFGRIVRTRVNAGQTKNQAFVEFDSVTTAIQMITFFVGNADPPKVRNKVVYLQYSTRQEIGSGFGNAPDPSGNVLLVIMDNIKVDLGPSLDTLALVFSAFGQVAKISMFEKSAGLQALVQYSDSRQAREAREALDGRTIPDYLVPQHPGSITMKVSYSQHSDLNVRCQTERCRDFTNPYLPTAGDLAPSGSTGAGAAPQAAVAAAAAAAAAAGPAAPGHGSSGPPSTSSSAVVLCQFENVQYAPTASALRTVFSTYGTVQKIVIQEQGGAWQAHVQYTGGDGALKAQQFLNGYSMYAGGVNKLHVSVAPPSSADQLAVRANTDRCWDAGLAGSGPGQGATRSAAPTTASGQPAAAAAQPSAGPSPSSAAGADAGGGMAMLGPAAGPVANPVSAAAAAAAVRKQAVAARGGSPPSSSSRDHLPLLTGADWEAAHEAVAQEAAAILAGGGPRGAPAVPGPGRGPLHHPPAVHRGGMRAPPPHHPYGGYGEPPPPYGHMPPPPGPYHTGGPGGYPPYPQYAPY